MTRACPPGPTITTFGLANAANEPEKPIGYDSAGRPIFNRRLRPGLLARRRGRAGANGRQPGPVPGAVLDGRGPHDPDMQMILSRALGNGDPAICDATPPDLGGVPATSPFLFTSTPAALDHIHDMGCRFVDGTAS